MSIGIVNNMNALGFGGSSNIYDPNNWVNAMLISYFDVINTHFDSTSKAAYLPVLQARLQPTYVDSSGTGYLYTTFGQTGQNKTVCDFILLFKTTKATALTTRTVTKTGATLRWDYSGTIYSQNDLPAQISSTGFISCSSTDGFATCTSFNINANLFTLNVPSLKYFINATQITLSTNAFNGTLPALTTNTKLQFLYIGGNAFTGTFPSMTGLTALREVLASTNHFSGSMPDLNFSSQLRYVEFATNLFTGTLKNVTSGILITYQFPGNAITTNDITTFGVAMTTFNVSDNNLPTAEIDEVLSNIDTYFATRTPTANCTYNLSGANMGIPTGGASNVSITGIMDKYTAAGKVATILVRTS